MQADTVPPPTRNNSGSVKAYDVWRLATFLYDSLLRPLTTGTCHEGKPVVILPRPGSPSAEAKQISVDPSTETCATAFDHSADVCGSISDATPSNNVPGSALSEDPAVPQELVSVEALTVQLLSDDDEDDKGIGHWEHLSELIAKPAGTDFVPALADTLSRVAASSTSADPNMASTRFHAQKIPKISLQDYAVRIAKHFHCSDECFVLALVYIDRIVKLQPGFSIDERSVHRLLLASVTLAAKFFDDVYYSNSYYAKVGGVHNSELNTLESQLLRMVQWRLHVLPEEYEQYREHVLAAASGTAQPALETCEAVSVV